MAEKCIWCGVDDASDYHAVELFGRRFLLCEECFSIGWQLVGKLSRLRTELDRRSDRAGCAPGMEQQR
jgi:hypothetical protein